MKRIRLTLLQKGLLVIALPIVYQAVLLGVLIGRQQEHRRAVEEAVHTKNILLQLDELMLLLLQGQTDIRGYLLTADPYFREAAMRALEAVPEEERELERLVARTPDRSVDLTELRRIVAERNEWVGEMLTNATEMNWDAAVESVRSLRGQELMFAVQQEIRRLREVEETLDFHRSEGLRASAIQQNALLIFGLCLNVLIGGAVIYLFSRGITSRVALLNDNMQRMSRGEPLAPEAGGADEIADLDHGFHLMATELVDAHEKEQVYQHALEKRNTDLIQANRELDHKNQENEMFVYSVSHDLRSPLVNLQGFSKELGLVSEELQELLGAEQINDDARKRAHLLVQRDVNESIHYIQTAVKRLSAIIDALLRLSRAGRVEYAPEEVSVDALLEPIIGAMRNTIEEHNAEVVLLPVPPIWGDATAIEQIFANLLANAVNYLSPDRPGRIEVAALERPPAAVEGMTVYYVKDNGVGIPEAYQPKVFAVFQRLHPKMAPGEGIGLPLVRRMVERHGGRIWVESKEDQGATFFVALPSREHSPLTIAPKKESVRLFSRPA